MLQPARCNVRARRAPAQPSRRLTTATTAAPSSSAPKLQRRVYAFGHNVDGQLGLGQKVTVAEIPTRVSVLDGLDITSIACGDMHTVSVLRSGEMITWGNSEYGQCGHRDFIFEPKKITRMPAKMIAAACGRFHTLALSAENHVYSLGSGQQGALGHGAIDNEKYLRVLTALEKQKITKIACGWVHSLAINDQGDVFSWGGSAYGQLGHGEMMTRKLPTPIQGLRGKFVTHVTGGLYHSLAVVNNREIYGWGRNASEQLGLPLRVAFEPTKLPFELEDPDEQIAQLSTGMTHTVLITTKGRLFTWGTGQKGELGLGQAVQKISVPTLVPTEHTLVNSTLWTTHNIAVTDKGQVLVWGSSTDHQLGIAARKLVFEPTLLDCFPGERALSAATGFGHTIVLTETVA